MASNKEKDLRADAKNFCESLGNVFMMKRRDPQTQHLLEKAKSLIESLVSSSDKRQRTERPVIPPKPSRPGGGGGGGSMGQLWVKLDELKRENEDLKMRQLNKVSDKKTTSGKSQGPGEVIIADLHKTKGENEALKAQLEKANTSISEFEKINHALQDEFKRSKIAHEVTQSSLEKIKKEHRTLESSLNSVKTENDSLKMRLTHSVKPMKRPDTRFVENLNEKCRPSNIAVLYNNLESQEWVDAKEALEDSGFESEESITRFLCAVLMLCHEASGELLDEIGTSISDILLDPSKVLRDDGSPPLGAKHSNILPEDVTHSIKEILRQHVEKIDVDPLVQKCHDKIGRSCSWSEFEPSLGHKSLRRYTEQCARTTWQMVVQQTPMWLAQEEGEMFDEDRHRLWWSCSQANARTIKHCVWPSLYDVKGGNLMVKGCVFAD